MTAQRQKTQSSITCSRAAIPAVTTDVTLPRGCHRISIWTEPGSANLHINLAGSPCTTSGAMLTPGTGFEYVSEVDEIESFSILGASATGSYNLIAY